MSATLTTPGFSYDALEPEVCTLIAQATAEIHILLRSAFGGIFTVGGMLAQVKESLPHGQWGKWLDHEFGWSDDTAQRMIRVHATFKNRNLRDVDIAPSALYALCSPSTPEVAREAALERAANGEKITNAKAKEIIGAAKELEADTEPEPAPPANQPSFDELFADLHPSDAGPVDAEWEETAPEEKPKKVTAVPDDEPHSTLDGNSELAALVYAFLTALPQEFKRRWVTDKEKGYPFNQLSLQQLKFVRGGVHVARNFLNDADAKIQDQILFLEGGN